jgi:hypothetical protein
MPFYRKRMQSKTNRGKSLQMMTKKLTSIILFLPNIFSSDTGLHDVPVEIELLVEYPHNI